MVADVFCHHFFAAGEANFRIEVLNYYCYSLLFLLFTSFILNFVNNN